MTAASGDGIKGHSKDQVRLAQQPRRQSRKIRSGGLILILVCALNFATLAEASAHPTWQTTLPNTTRAYLAAGHDWRSQDDWNCGGRYSLNIGNKIQRTLSSVDYFKDTRVHAYNLDGAPPSAGVIEIWKASDGEVYESFVMNEATIPTGGFLLGPTVVTTLPYNPSQAPHLVFKSHAGGVTAWFCTNIDKHVYYH